VLLSSTVVIFDTVAFSDTVLVFSTQLLKETSGFVPDEARARSQSVRQIKTASVIPNRCTSSVLQQRHFSRSAKNMRTSLFLLQ